MTAKKSSSTPQLSKEPAVAVPAKSAKPKKGGVTAQALPAETKPEPRQEAKRDTKKDAKKDDKKVVKKDVKKETKAKTKAKGKAEVVESDVADLELGLEGDLEIEVEA